MTDVELAERAAGGDADAVQILYERYGRFALAQAYRWGAGDDAEDVRQELFCRLVEGRGWGVRSEAAPPDGTLHGLLSVTIRRLALGRAWRRKFHGTVPEDQDIGDLVPLWAFTSETPEERTLRLERTARLRWAFRSLPQRLRQVAHLRYLECLSGPAIAARLGLQATTIPSYLATIRARLRPLLALVYALPAPGRCGHQRFDGPDVPHTARRLHSYAKRRRARSLARQRETTP